MERFTTLSENFEPGDIPPWNSAGNRFGDVFDDHRQLPLDYVRGLGDGKTSVMQHYSSELKKHVALKTVYIRSEENKGHLKNEVEHLLNLRHYHIVQVIGTFYSNKHLVMILDPVADCDLRAYMSSDSDKDKNIKEMKNRHGLGDVHLPRLMGCLARTLAYVHEKENYAVRHRDIKPANILLQGPKVLLADFHLSKQITETTTGSSGDSQKTWMYTSPERARDKHRNASCDIFSLACVFAEMFVKYKGGSCEDFLNFRREAEQKKIEKELRDQSAEHISDKAKGEGCYFRVVQDVMEWLQRFKKEGCDAKFLELLRTMFSEDPETRPSAQEVWKRLTSCTRRLNSPQLSSTYFCGPCCMPLLSNDPLFRANKLCDPATVPYTSDIDAKDAFRISRADFKNDPKWKPFREDIAPNRQLGLKWVRNVRHWDDSIVDIVHLQGHKHSLARKRAISNGNDEQFQLLCNEIHTLKKVQHRHIVELYGTFKQGNTYTLLFEPAANFNLRTFLDLANFSEEGNRMLTQSFGCLANALAWVHRCGFDHGDIRCENILVHKDETLCRVYLSKFSFSRNIRDNGGEKRGFSLPLWRGQKDKSGASMQCRTRGTVVHNATSARYRSPEWNKKEEETELGQPAADVFSLGCVFTEIYTVLSEKSIADLENFCTSGRKRNVYRDNIERALNWLSELEKRPYNTKEEFINCLKLMIEENVEARPSARIVASQMHKCRDFNGLRRTGGCDINSD